MRAPGPKQNHNKNTKKPEKNLRKVLERLPAILRAFT